MTSKLTREQAQQIIDAADAVISALAGTNDEVHKDDTDKMVHLWDDLNDRYAPPEVVRELASMALAAMDSEPVAWVSSESLDSRLAGIEAVTIPFVPGMDIPLFRHPVVTHNGDCDTDPFGFARRSGDLVVIDVNGDPHIKDGMPLYRHAQPVPVVSTDLLHTAASAIEDLLTTKDRAGAGVWFDLPFRLRSAANAQPAPVVVPNGLRLALSNAGIAAPESDEMLAATCEKHIQALVAWVRNRKPFQSAPVVPEEANPDSIEILASARRRDHAVFQWDEDQRNAAADSWNACRAAMLAAATQEVKGES